MSGTVRIQIRIRHGHGYGHDMDTEIPAKLKKYTTWTRQYTY